MSIVRIKHQRNYTCIANDALRDSSLSFKARGILAFLLSFPDNWQINTSHLVSASDVDGKTAVESGLKELREKGYMKKVAIRDETGRIAKWETQISEEPTPEPGKPRTRKTQSLENQNLENPPSGNHGAILNTDQYEVLNLSSNEQTKARAPEKPAIALVPIPKDIRGERSQETETHPISSEEQKLSVETNIPPAAVEIVVNNPYDDAILNGHQHRRDYRARHKAENNAGAFGSVENRDDFYRQCVSRLMATDSRLEMGKAQGIAAGFCRQISSGEITNPTASQYFELWQRGEMAIAPPTTAKEIKSTQAFGAWINSKGA